MALESCVWQNPYNNLLADPIKEQNELAGSQNQAKRSDASSNKAPTPLEAPIQPFVPPIEDFFIKFMKVFIESTQAWDRKQVESQK